MPKLDDFCKFLNENIFWIENFVFWKSGFYAAWKFENYVDVIKHGERHRFWTLRQILNFAKRAHEKIEKPKLGTNAKIDLSVKFWLENCFLKFKKVQNSFSGHTFGFLLLKIRRVALDAVVQIVVAVAFVAVPTAVGLGFCVRKTIDKKWQNRRLKNKLIQFSLKTAF